MQWLLGLQVTVLLGLRVTVLLGLRVTVLLAWQVLYPLRHIHSPLFCAVSSRAFTVLLRLVSDPSVHASASEVAVAVTVLPSLLRLWD